MRSNLVGQRRSQVMSWWAPAREDYGTGSVYVYRYDPLEEEWAEEQKLEVGDDEFREYGNDISVGDDLFVVGAQRDDESAWRAGAAFVYRYDADEGEWVEEQKLLASDAAEEDLFGYSVAISGEVIVVGAIGRGDDEEAGSAYVFRYDSSEDEWVEEQKLTASDGDADDHFRRVSISNNVIVVGAFHDEDNGHESGSAYVFRYDSAEESWVEEQKLLASDGGARDAFGWDVAVTDDVVLVGANGANECKGATYLFHFHAEDETWVEEQKLIADSLNIHAGFGYSVCFSDGVALIGAIGAENDNDFDTGAAYVYDIDFDQPFLRGDANGNGDVDALTDSLFLLQWAFTGGEEPACRDAADADDSGKVFALTDVHCLLSWAFLVGPDLPDPGPDTCDLDPTEDLLHCANGGEACP